MVPRKRLGRALAGLLLTGVGAPPAAADDLATAAAAALERATSFLSEEVAVEGSYLWKYTAGLDERWGEARATDTQGWAQPPGTPTIGLAFLRAFVATGDPQFLEAAREAGRALARTQLVSGGWWYSIEFDPEQRKTWCYRVDQQREERPSDDGEGGYSCRTSGDNEYRNASTFDDDTSQSSLRFLMLLDAHLDEPDEAIEVAIKYGLDQFIANQYPNGAFAMRADKKVENALTTSAWRSRFPYDWSRTYVEIPEPLFYSTNDFIVREAIRVFLLAHHLYGEEAYLATAMRAGDFLLSAQLPAPQRAWAQIYNRDLEPIWARKFEPPSVATRESRGAIEALLDLYLVSGADRYLEGASAAVDWLRKIQLADGTWARFNELQINRPLYFTSDYELTYDDGDLPRHYSFRGIYDIPVTLAFHALVVADPAAARERLAMTQLDPTEQQALMGCLRDEVAQAVEALDAEGRWLDRKGLLQMATYARNLDILISYIAAADGRWVDLERSAAGVGLGYLLLESEQPCPEEG